MAKERGEKMTKYEVEICRKQYQYIEVEANNEAEAKKKAFAEIKESKWDDYQNDYDYQVTFLK